MKKESFQKKVFDLTCDRIQTVYRLRPEEANIAAHLILEHDIPWAKALSGDKKDKHTFHSSLHILVNQLH